MAERLTGPENVAEEERFFRDVAEHVESLQGWDMARRMHATLLEARPLLIERFSAFLREAKRGRMPQREGRDFSAYELLLALAWKVEIGMFKMWALDRTQSVADLLEEYRNAMDEKIEQISSIVYTTADKQWELTRVHHRASIEAVGRHLGNCLASLSDSPGSRYFTLSRLQGDGRAEVEFYALRPAREGAGARLDATERQAVLLCSYLPELHLLLEVEKRSRSSSLPGTVYLDGSEPFSGALFEVIQTSRAGNIPGLDVQHIDPVAVLHLVSTGQGLLANGSVVSLGDANAHELIAGRFAVTPDTPIPELVHMAEKIPITIDMTHATNEQREALTLVVGSVIDRSFLERCVYERLQYVGQSFYIGRAVEVYLPALTHIGAMLNIPFARAVKAPELEQVFMVRVPVGAKTQWKLHEKPRVSRLR